MENIYKSKYYRWTITWFYPIQVFVAYTKMRGNSLNMYLGIPMDIVFIVLSFILIRNTLMNDIENAKHTKLFAWVTYVLLSIFIYFLYNTPFACYFDAMKLSIFPILFYFWGKDQRDTSDSFYKSLMITSTIAMIVGFYLYIFTPQYYLNYLLLKHDNSMMDRAYATIDTIIENNRFSSFLESSYTVCFYAVSSLCIGLTFLLHRRTNFKPIYMVLFIVVNLIASILSQQRIAMFFSICYFIIFSVYGFKYNNVIVKKMFVTVLVISIIGVNVLILANERLQTIAGLLIERFEMMDLDKAISGRSSQYELNDVYAIELITGKGLGSSGHSAISYGLKGVTDAEYYKMLRENGVIGLILFFIVIVSSLKKVMKYYRCYLLEIAIVLFYLAACIGANALSMYFTTGIFWFALGRMNNQAYRKRLYNESCK